MSLPTIDQEFTDDVANYHSWGQTLNEMHQSMIEKGWNEAGLFDVMVYAMNSDADIRQQQRDFLKDWLLDDADHAPDLTGYLATDTLQQVSDFLANESVNDVPVVVLASVLDEYRNDPSPWNASRTVQQVESWLSGNESYCSSFVQAIRDNILYTGIDAAMQYPPGSSKRLIGRNPAFRVVFLTSHPYAAQSRAMSRLQLFEDRLSAGCTYEELEELYKPRVQAALFRSLHPDTQDEVFDSFLQGSYQRHLQWNAIREKLRDPAIVLPMTELPANIINDLEVQVWDMSIEARTQRAREAEPEYADNASVFSPEQRAEFVYQTPTQYDEAGPANAGYGHDDIGYLQEWQGEENPGYDQGSYGYYENDGSQGYQDQVW